MNVDKQIRDLLDQGDKRERVRLGTIPPDYLTGSPQVIGDGESEPSTKTYPVVQAYSETSMPAPGDRVIMQRQGKGWVVAGKIADLPDNPDGGGGGPGGPASGSYEQIFAEPTDVWEATHNLGYTPAVGTYDTQGRSVRGNVEYNDAIRTRVTFFFPVAGRMVLS